MNEQTNNVLKASLNDLMKYSGELLLQQQLQTIRLDPQVMCSRDQRRTRCMEQSISHFHSILDNMDLTLLNSQVFLEKYSQELVIKRKLEEEEEERERIIKEERMIREEREKERERVERAEREKLERERLELEKAKQHQEMNYRSSLNNTPISASIPTGVQDFGMGMDLSIFNGMNNTDSFVNPMNAATTAPTTTAPNTTTTTTTTTINNNNNNNNNNNSNTGIQDIAGISQSNGDDDILQLGFPTQDSSNNFNMDVLGDFQNSSTTTNNNNNNNNNNSNNSNNNTNNNTNIKPQFNTGTAEDDQYLTLNDFNDLGIDWGSNEY